ncbi:DUF2865 domain-containing protein [Phreatobacter sp.]|uniref:DUF2865 domain-containing protein n=1 Tax=Phreatobacter sp. TaxID=1966341 RepID=UPI003F7216BE
MRPRFGQFRFAAVAGALAVAALVAHVPTAAAQSPVCRQIQVQIARLDSAPAGGPVNRRFAAAAQRQRGEIATAEAQFRGAGCGGFFQGPQCGALSSRIRQMRANLARLEASAGGAGVQSVQRGQQRARLIAMLDANGCRGGRPVETRQAVAPPSQRQEWVTDEGPERQIYRRIRTPEPGMGPQTAYRVGPEAQRPGFGGFIEHLFGRQDPRPGDPDYVAPVPEDQLRPGDGDGRPRGLGYRAVCVRLCDGAFFPMTSSARPGANIDEEGMCRMQCPGAEVALYRMRDDQIENAVSAAGGRPYASLPNALRFRQAFDAGCTCRPSHGSWAEAFSSRPDPTLRPGDQVISAEQARLLSMPAAHRQAAREEMAAEQRARLAAERQARIDRSRRRDGTPSPTIGLDGTVRPPVEAEAPELREGRDADPAEEPDAGADDPADRERRPVRIIGPSYAPRADAPVLPSGG